MQLDSIRIVLVNPSHPGNIGSTARAMKTMGLEQLYLVDPKQFPDPQAYDLAAGADNILEKAQITATLKEALQGCQWVFGTSARGRGIGAPLMTPEECGKQISQAGNSTVAIVFGRERTGLSNEELSHCHYHVHITANPEYSSLNLAHAVQILAYEVRKHVMGQCLDLPKREDKMATFDEIDQFYTHLKEVMFEVGFLKPSLPRRLMERMRRMFNRVQLEEMEVQLLRGLLSQIQKTIAANKGED